ncbi:hypothetical protein D9V86_01920, partial [Bacteroidetes/Chlorobi group bacterium ChocPot_Mid]
IVDGTIADADISGTAAIAYSKLAAIPTGSFLYGNAGTPTVGAMSGDATINNAGALTIGTGAVTSGKIADGTIVDADINTSAAIAYSKLNLANSIVNADISGTAAIAYSKLAAIPTGSFLFGNAGTPTVGAMSGDATINNAGALTIGTGAVTSAKILDGTIVDADINASAAIAYSKLNLANSIVTGDIVDGTIVDADISGTAAIAYSKLNLANSIVTGDIVDGTIVDADISGTAAIAYSKLNLANSIVTGDIVDGTIVAADMDLTGTYNYTGTLQVNGNNVLTTASIGTMGAQNANSVAITGGIIDGTVIGNTTAAAATFTTLQATGITQITNGTTSTNTTTGALTVAGGVGINENLNVANNTLLGGTLGVSGITSITNATSSTGTGDGALVVTGGVGIGDNLNVGGSLSVTSSANLADATISATSSSPALFVDNAGTGLALEINDGGGAVKLSYQAISVAGDAAIIPNDVSVVYITSDNNTTNDAITMPSGTNGQFLYVILVGTDLFDINGEIGIPAAKITYVHANGGWLKISSL